MAHFLGPIGEDELKVLVTEQRTATGSYFLIELGEIGGLSIFASDSFI